MNPNDVRAAVLAVVHYIDAPDHAGGNPRVATMNVDRTKRGPSPRSSLTALAGRTFGAIPPPALVLLGIVSVQVGSALAKRLFSAVGSFGTVALRLFFAAAALMLLWRPSVRMNRRTWTVALSYGVILGLMNLCFYLALARIPLGIAVTIEFLGPLAVALAGSRRWLDAFWAVLAAGGMVLLMEGRGDLNLVGFLFALAAGTCWGLYIMVGAALGRHTTEGNGLALGMAVAALKEQLALRLVYTRIKSESDQRVTRQRGIALPKLPEPAPGETGPYCVIAKHRAKPGKADAYERRMLADLYKTRAEPGALQFHIHRDRSDPDLFVIYEVWRDLRALREHYEKPYVKQFVVDSAEYIEGDMEAQWIVMASQYVAGRPRETRK